MRIATWNVNSLKARLDAVEKWLKRAEPDVLLMQETKVADDDVPEHAVPDGRLHDRPPRRGPLERRGDRQQGTRHGRRSTNFGDGPVRDSSAGASNAAEDDFDPFDEARMVSGVTFGIRFTSVYAPNGRVVGSPFYDGKLRWFDRVERWVQETRDLGPSRSSSVGTSTSRPRPTTCGTRSRPTAARTSARRSARSSPTSGRWA